MSSRCCARRKSEVGAMTGRGGEEGEERGSPWWANGQAGCLEGKQAVECGAGSLWWAARRAVSGGRRERRRRGRRSLLQPRPRRQPARAPRQRGSRHSSATCHGGAPCFPSSRHHRSRPRAHLVPHLLLLASPAPRPSRRSTSAQASSATTRSSPSSASSATTARPA